LSLFIQGKGAHFDLMSLPNSRVFNLSSYFYFLGFKKIKKKSNIQKKHKFQKGFFFSIKKTKQNKTKQKLDSHQETFPF